MDLQRHLIESQKQNGGRGRWKASAGSLVAHALLIGGIIFAGAHSTKHTVAAEREIKAFVTQGAAPPPPPPPPPPPKASGGAPKVVKLQPKPVVTPQRSFVAPVTIPKEVPKVNIPAPMTSAVETPEEEPEQVADAGSGPGGDALNGVTGGVTGGVAGGVVGGEVGGTVGGELGGVKGGEIGGVLGGQVGGTGTGKEGTGTGGIEAPVAPAPEPEPPPPPPPPVPSGPLRVGGDVKAPVTVDRADPVYTNAARSARIEGMVIVEAVISKSGVVQDVRVVKGLPMGLSEEAERAVKKWRFKPGTLNGQPVATIFNLTVNFKLD